MYGSDEYRFFSTSPDPNYRTPYHNMTGVPPAPHYDSQRMYDPRGPSLGPAPSSRRNEVPHSQPADPLPAHTGFRPASHMPYTSSGQWSAGPTAQYTFNNRSYPRYQTSRPADPAASSTNRTAAHTSSTSSGSQRGHATYSRQPTATCTSSSSAPASSTRPVSSEADEIGKKKKEIERQDKILNEIADERKKLDQKEQEARLKIATLRSEITTLARQQQQREEAQLRQQQIQQHAQQQLNQIRMQPAPVPNYAPRAPIAVQYNQDPRSLVNMVRSAPTTQPYAPSTATIGSVTFSKLSQRFNVITGSDCLKSQIFFPKTVSRFEFMVNKKPDKEKILLRICAFDRTKQEQADHISCRLNVLLNSLPVFGNKKAPVRGPLDITSKICEGRNIVEVREVELPTGAVSDPLPLECGIHVIKAYKMDVSVTLKMLEGDKKYCRPENETLNMIRKQFKSSDSIDVMDVKVPLTCPLTKKRLLIPCYGANCKHLCFFDGKAFVEMNYSRDEWSCPHCKSTIGMDELRVDGLIRKVLGECKPYVTQIAFDKNGCWKPVDDAGESKKDKLRETNAEKDEDIIVLDDSDDETVCSRMNPVPRGETTERSSPPDTNGDSNDSDIIARRRKRGKRVTDSDDSDQTAESSESSESEEGQTSTSDSSDSSSPSSSSSSGRRFKKKSGKASATTTKRKPGPKSRTVPQKKRKGRV